MANQVIPEELNQLIQEYLTDGIITAKERQVLLRKAQSMGLDVDEVDLYIDAQQQKADQQVDAAVRKQRGQQCPFCGGSVPQLADKCPHCGQHITVEAGDELKEIIDNLENALVNFKSGKNVNENRAIVERYVRKAETYYGHNPKIQQLLASVKQESEMAEKRAKSAERKSTIGKVLTYNMKLTSAVVLIIVIALIFGIKAMFSGPDMSDEKVFIEQTTKAISNGDLDKAEANVDMYIQAASEKTSYKGDILKTANGMYAQIAAAALEKDDLSKAIGLKAKMDNGYAGNSMEELSVKIAEKYIQKGQYEDALNISGYTNAIVHGEKALNLLSKCVADMVEKNQTEKARRFINAHYRWCQDGEDAEAAKQHLLGILGE